MRYSNVGWIDDWIAVKRKSSSELLAPAPKHQRSNSTLEENLESSNILNDSPVFADFRYFAPTQDVPHPSRNLLPSRSISILSSALSSSENLDPPLTTPTNAIAVHRPVTRSQGKILAGPQALIASDPMEA